MLVKNSNFARIFLPVGFRDPLFGILFLLCPVFAKDVVCQHLTWGMLPPGFRLLFCPSLAGVIYLLFHSLGSQCILGSRLVLICNNYRVHLEHIRRPTLALSWPVRSLVLFQLYKKKLHNYFLEIIFPGPHTQT